MIEIYEEFGVIQLDENGNILNQEEIDKAIKEQLEINEKNEKKVLKDKEKDESLDDVALY